MKGKNPSTDQSQLFGFTATLVVAYAIAGSIRKDLTKEPLAIVNDEPVYLSDIWPSNEEVNAYVQEYTIGPEAFRAAYEHLFDANERWNAIEIHREHVMNGRNIPYIAHPPCLKH